VIRWLSRFVTYWLGGCGVFYPRHDYKRLSIEPIGERYRWQLRFRCTRCGKTREVTRP